MTFELQRDPRDDLFVPVKVTVRLSEREYNSGRVILNMQPGRPGAARYNVALSEREVDDLITALQYYKQLAKEASRTEN